MELVCCGWGGREGLWWVGILKPILHYMCWVCVLVTSNVLKREEKYKQLAQCNIESFEILCWVIFSHFFHGFLAFHRHVGIQNARKKNASVTTHSVIRPLVFMINPFCIHFFTISVYAKALTAESFIIAMPWLKV